MRSLPSLPVALVSLLLSLCTHSVEASTKAIPSVFENSEVIRTIELGGSTSYVSTAIVASALEDNVSKYTVTLSEEEYSVTSWFQARLKGASEELPVQILPATPSRPEAQYTITIPRLKSGETLNLMIDTVQTHASYAWPAETAQDGRQILRYRGNLLVTSPYNTKEQRTKFRGSQARIIGYTKLDVPTIEQYLSSDKAVTKSGNVVQYGPFVGLPPSTNPEFPRLRVQLEYDYSSPVLTITELKRTAEISHWGSNINVENHIKLRNDGPKVSGQFSRFDYQQQKYIRQIPSHIVEEVRLILPGGIHAPYYYDLNGNVSTSHFRPSPQPKKADDKLRPSYLEFRPRYPLLGGWNYTFTIGWDAPLKYSSKYDSKTGTYVVAVPFWTPVPDAIVDDAEVSIILPEGAEDVEVETPFADVKLEYATAISYLDTIGRPKIVMKAKRLTDKHAGVVYVSYKVSLIAHLRKPVAVTIGTFGLFALSWLIGWDSQFLQKKNGKN